MILLVLEHIVVIISVSPQFRWKADRRGASARNGIHNTRMRLIALKHLTSVLILI